MFLGLATPKSPKISRQLRPILVLPPHPRNCLSVCLRADIAPRLSVSLCLSSSSYSLALALALARALALALWLCFPPFTSLLFCFHLSNPSALDPEWGNHKQDADYQQVCGYVNP